MKKTSKFKRFLSFYSDLIMLFLFGVFISASTESKYSDADGVTLAPVFDSHMVLQQNEPIIIWGEAVPGTKIVIKLGREERNTKADKNGEWLVAFDARKASFEPITLQVNNLKFEDILIGEVWICSGQSNMEFTLKRIDTYPSIRKNTLNNNLRLFKAKSIRVTAKEGYTNEELARCNTKDFFQTDGWTISNDSTAALTSAVAWLFGQGLQTKLKVPVGIIQVTLGGSALNSWISPQTLKSNPLTAFLYEKDWFSNEYVKLAHRQRGQDAFQHILKPGEPYIPEQFPYRWLCEPGFLFEAGIEPLKQLSFCGVVWYQGESDADNLEMVNRAKELLPMMIHEWRNHFNMGDFPFIAIQLPGVDREYWPNFREMQRQTMQELENTYLVVSFDLGDEKNVHPKDKQPIGERAHRMALKNVYGFTDLIGFPELENWSLNTDEIILQFTEIGEGFRSTADTITGFEIAGEDGIFLEAKAYITTANTIKVQCPVKKPLCLRYAWMPFPKPALMLFNSESLPLGPFSIDLKNE